MPVVQLPDGTLVQLPDFPEETGWDKAKRVGKVAGSAIMRGLAALPASMAEGGLALNLERGMRVKGYNLPSDVAEDVGKIGTRPVTPGEKYLASGLEGTTSGLTMPIGGPIAATFSGGVGGLSAEAGDQLSGGNPLIRGLAGLVGGGAAGFATGPRQSVAKADIRRELADVPEADWQKATENAANFQNVGAKTATAAEAFPGKTRITALANQAANSRGGEALGQQLSSREDDLANLGQTFIDRIGPRAEPSKIANDLAEAANGYLKGQKQIDSTVLGNRLAGKTISPQSARDLHDTLLKVADMQTVPAIANAYREVAGKLVSTDGEILRNVQDLSFQIKSLKDAPKNPLSPLSGAPNISAGFGRQAIGDAEQGLGELSPSFEQGMQEFRLGKQAYGKTAEGPIGKLADRNPLSLLATPTGRLNAVVAGNNPQTIGGTARTLSNPVMTGGPTVSARDIASALAQQKLHEGSRNPGATMRGIPGSGAEDNFSELLRQGGKNPDQVMAPLRAADQMQNLGPAANVNSLPEIRSGQFLIRPFRALDMALSAHSSEAVQREISELLKDPRNIPQLKEIAMFNPMVRRFLTANSAVQPVIQSAQGNQ